jgi:hypothetical protein
MFKIEKVYKGTRLLLICQNSLHELYLDWHR